MNMMETKSPGPVPAEVCFLCLLQRVEDTVDKLEAGLVELLDIIKAPQWRPLLDETGKTQVDILQDVDLKHQP